MGGLKEQLNLYSKQISQHAKIENIIIAGPFCHYLTTKWIKKYFPGGYFSC